MKYLVAGFKGGEGGGGERSRRVVSSVINGTFSDLWCMFEHCAVLYFAQDRHFLSPLSLSRSSYINTRFLLKKAAEWLCKWQATGL